MAFGKTFQRLDGADLVGPVALRNLARVGIISIEELLSALVADRTSVRDLLGLTDTETARLERRCRRLADPEVVRAAGVKQRRYPLGALPPIEPERRRSAR